tara:strand:+ start:20 stop:310 length:291 start_codon:yes stop_codon:yes gene_type:complete
MKKILISVTALFFLTSSFIEEKVYIYCKPDIKIAIQNLKQLRYWIELDHKDNKINENMYTEYHIAVQNTILSLEMILDNKGQCDTSDTKIYKLKYN